MSMCVKSRVVGVFIMAIAAAAMAADAVAPPSPASGPVAAPAPAISAATNAAGVEGARIQFDSKIFDFGKVVSGEVVKHVYYFTNVGTQDLIITNVQPGCHCTTAGDWTRVVKPGESGKIPIQLNSANFNGLVARFVTVTCNDKSQPTIPLQIKGNAWKPIQFTPQVAALNLKPDAPFSSAIIRITNALDELVWLSTPQSSNPAFGAELRTNWPGKEYLVIISNTMVMPSGSSRANITMTTSATNVLPLIDILAWANVPPIISVTPAQVTVPRAPLPTNFTSTVTIINNSTNSLTLSEPAVNSTNIQAAIKELQPGHYYTVTLKFQPGFEMPSSPLVFSAKTSNPKMPAIKVPIVELARRYPPAQTPGPIKRPVSVAPPGGVPPAKPAPPTSAPPAQ